MPIGSLTRRDVIFEPHTIRAQRRRLFWASFRQAAAAALEDPAAAAEEAADRELFEGTLDDGLDAEPVPD